MPDDQAAPDQAVGPERQRPADLPVHLDDRLPRDAGILCDRGVLVREVRFGVLQVREVDVHDAGKQPEHVHRVKGVGVIDERKVKPVTRSDLERLDDLRDNMAWRDDPDAMAAAVLEFQHDLRKAFDRHLVLPFHAVVLADLVVLAVRAAEVAVAEEDVADSAGADEERFLAEVRRVGRDDGQPPRIASGDLVVEAVGTAVVGADGAGGEEAVQLLDPPGKLARLRQCEV